MTRTVTIQADMSMTCRSYYRARYYDSALGRFVSEDPIGIRGGLNKFRYVGNRPIRYSDPNGLKEKPYEVLAKNGRDPLKIPGLCHPSPCLQGCLQSIFGQVLPVYITPNSRAIEPLLGYAVSGYGTLDLPGSCDDFFGDSIWVLHEYYHVVYQWQYHPGRFLPDYMSQAVIHLGNHDAIPIETEAQSFAEGSAPMLDECLKKCKDCKK